MYELRYMPPAQKYFKKLKDKKLIDAYNKALDTISADPYQGEAKSGDLAGIYCMNVYRNRSFFLFVNNSAAADNRLKRIYSPTEYPTTVLNKLANEEGA